MFSLKRWVKLAGLTRLAEGNESNKLISSLTSEGMAVGILDHDDEKTVVIYDPKLMKSAIENLDGPHSVGDMPEAIIGMLRLAPPVYGSGTKDS